MGKCRFLVAGFHFNRTTYQNNFFFYLHIYLLIFFIYSSFSSTFFTDISPGSVGVLVNGESHVSVSQVSEVTTFHKLYPNLIWWYFLLAALDSLEPIHFYFYHNRARRELKVVPLISWAKFS